MKKPQIFNFLLGAAGGALVLGGYLLIANPNRPLLVNGEAVNSRLVSLSGESHTTEFVYASQLATPAVVHIKSVAEVRPSGYNRRSPRLEEELMPFRFFYDEGDRSPIPSLSSGSGVIISNDGYIVTNYHVIKDAQKLEVTLNDNRSFQASVVGADPSTDLAVVKIQETNLPTLKFGDSDDVQVGEWVLAVGNPFNLTSTVTAGIVSAKGRSINILNDKYRIESFIQTDAAVNPGNSGGALVNTKGELIGINTAIATRTGTYNGYSFAVPARIVSKVVEDLMKYGEVQRGYLGVVIRSMDAELAEKEDLDVKQGVYISDINENSAAEDAGLKRGDVILKVDDRTVSTSSELQEYIGSKRPGDKVTITFLRNNVKKIVDVTLKNKSGKAEISAKSRSSISEKLGAELAPIGKDEMRRFRISGGVKVTQLYAGKLRDGGIPEGFIITHIDKNEVHTREDVHNTLKDKSGAVLIEGYSPNGRFEAYAILF